MVAIVFCKIIIVILIFVFCDIKYNQIQNKGKFGKIIKFDRYKIWPSRVKKYYH